MSSDADVIRNLAGSVTKKWTKQRKREEREARAVGNRRSCFYSTRITAREVAWRIMETAYLKASAGGALPAHARQIMYAARGTIQAQTGKPLSDQYFCQTLLPDYLREYGLEDTWQVVFDPRGNLTEPHTGLKVPLGTLEVRSYLQNTRQAGLHYDDLGGDSTFGSTRIVTAGPEHRYSAILFVEKEGFMPLFRKVKLAERYDIAIMSTKGMSVIAARELIDSLCSTHNIPVLILRDFDQAGFIIASTLVNDTKRYKFRNHFKSFDLGLRLEDIQKYGLESEEVSYSSGDPRWGLKKNGATPEEINFLCEGGDSWSSGYHGKRVELNAFPSDQLVKWIETKLEEYGIEKVIPNETWLASAYRRAHILAYVREQLDAFIEDAEKLVEGVAIPGDLRTRVTQLLKADPTLPWDEAVMMVISTGESQA